MHPILLPSAPPLPTLSACALVACARIHPSLPSTLSTHTTHLPKTSRCTITPPPHTTHQFSSSNVNFAGPITGSDADGAKNLYVIGTTCKSSGASCGQWAIHQIDVSRGPSETTGTVLYTWAATQFGLRDAALGWDADKKRIFWCLGDSQASSSLWGKCYSFEPGTDTAPQAWGKTGIGQHTQVGSGVRGQATLQKTGDGKLYLYLAGKKGVWRQEVTDPAAGPTGTGEVKIVTQDTHTQVSCARRP